MESTFQEHPTNNSPSAVNGLLVAVGIIAGLGAGLLLLFNYLLPKPAHSTSDNPFQADSKSLTTPSEESEGDKQSVLRPF